MARRPSRTTIDRFLLDSQDLPLSYGPIGIVRAETARRGLDEAIVAVGRGNTDFARARAALMAWKQFDIGVKLPGDYERPGEIVECTALGYALLFGGASQRRTVTLLRERGAVE